MKNRIKLFMMMIALTSFALQAAQKVQIIPAPKHLEVKEGKFNLTPTAKFYANTPEGQTVAAFFAAKMSAATGYALPVAAEDKHTAIYLLTDAQAVNNAEGYLLEVKSNQVIVTASTPQGLFYGMQSFMQLLPPDIESPTTVARAWTAPAVLVRDEPRFGYRGLMLDPCRHFVPKDFVKKQIDVLALFKINRLHWHLTDDQGWRIEIKRYPRLTEIGSKSNNSEGFYTQEDIREIVAYAAERFITVIPEIELPGHELAAIAAYPELSCRAEPTTPRLVWGVEDIVMCAGKESTFEFLENVFKEVIPLFPSKYIHIGGDEAPKTEWKKCPLCQQRIKDEHLEAADGHSAEERLQSYFVSRIEKFLAGYGKKIIGWDEILEGGLAPSATVMSWRGEKGGIAAAAMSHDAIMTSSYNGMYIDAYQGDPKIEPVAIGGYTLLSKVYDYNPIPDTLVQMGKAQHIIGVQCNAWSEYLYNTDVTEYRIYPRILALSEIAWTPLEDKDYDDFLDRLNNALPRLDKHKINYHIPQPEQPDGSCDFVVFIDRALLTFKTTRPIKMVYTTDGSEPTPQSTEYERPLKFMTSDTLKIRSVLPWGKMSPTRTIVIDKQRIAPAKTPEAIRDGIEMMVAYGEFPDIASLKEAQWNEPRMIRDFRALSRVEPSTNSMRNLKPYAAIASGYVRVAETGVYYVSSDNDAVYIDGKLLIDNFGEIKRYSRHDSSVALEKGLHSITVVFLGNIIGGWPSNWGDGHVSLRLSTEKQFKPINASMLFHEITE